MTIMAGILSLSPEASITDNLCRSLDTVLTRHPSDVTVRFRDGRLYLAKVDLGAFGSPAFHTGADGSAAVLVGEPLLDRGDGSLCLPRADDLKRLHEGMGGADWSVARQANGIFSSAHYLPGSATTILMTDKLALRPLYYCCTEGYLFFASSLRILEALEAIPKRMDLRGVTEMAVFGFPLADRTPYLDIKALEPGRVLSVSSGAIKSERYWRWDEVNRWGGSEESLIHQAYERFEEAILRRLGGDRATVSFLSGGLDSRVVVGLLRHLGVAVHTFTFGMADTQDSYCASSFAVAAATIHERVEPTNGPVNEWARMLAEAWEASPRRSESPPERPCLAWSGDGGSVIVGRVYLLSLIVHFLSSGKRREAINVYLDNFGSRIVKRLMHRKCYRDVKTMPYEGLLEELDKIECDDEVHRFYLFLILNDQRHHLREHYEHIDLHRMELHQPFFDSRFVETVVSGSVEDALYHRFYLKWLAHFPSVVTSVPWQSYPGHQPCPLPMPAGLGYQWGAAESQGRERRHRDHYLRDAGDMLTSPSFPRHLLARTSLRVAALAHRIGLRDYGYIIKTAKVYHRYWSITEGSAGA